MFLRDLQDILGNERRKRERAETIQKFAFGMGVMAVLGVATGILFAPKPGKETRKELREKAANTAEIIKDNVQEKMVTIKDSVANVAQETNAAIKNVQGRTEDIKKDLKDGSHEIKKDVQKTAKKVSDELK